MDKKKKDFEKRLLTRFISNSSLRMRISGLHALENEPPDFKIKRFVNGQFKEIGLEITRIINPSLKEIESAQEKTVELARRKFRSELKENLVVYVDFSENPFPFKEKDLQKIAEDLFNLVKTVAENNRGFKFNITTDEIKLNPIFRGITIKNDEDYGFENWQPFGAFRVPYIDETWFSSVIERKESKISNYSQAFDEKWLLMIANFGHESSAFQFSNLRAEFQKSKFDRIFIYNWMQDEIIRIKRK